MSTFKMFWAVSHRLTSYNRKTLKCICLEHLIFTVRGQIQTELHSRKKPSNSPALFSVTVFTLGPDKKTLKKINLKTNNFRKHHIKPREKKKQTRGRVVWGFLNHYYLKDCY